MTSDGHHDIFNGGHKVIGTPVVCCHWLQMTKPDDVILAAGVLSEMYWATARVIIIIICALVWRGIVKRGFADIEKLCDLSSKGFSASSVSVL